MSIDEEIEKAADDWFFNNVYGEDSPQDGYKAGYRAALGKLVWKKISETPKEDWPGVDDVFLVGDRQVKKFYLGYISKYYLCPDGKPSWCAEGYDYGDSGPLEPSDLDTFEWARIRLPEE